MRAGLEKKSGHQSSLHASHGALMKAGHHAKDSKHDSKPAFGKSGGKAKGEGLMVSASNVKAIGSKSKG